MDNKQLITIVVTAVITEIVKRFASLIADNLKKTKTAKTATTIFKILINRFLMIVGLQLIIFYLILSLLLKLINSNAPVTNYAVFQIVFAYSIVLRVGFNTLKALRQYLEECTKKS